MSSDPKQLSLAMALQESQRRRATRNLRDFTLATCPYYRAGWFHQQVAAELEQFLADVEARRRPRLILSAPPQHGKSELSSRRFPAYALGRNPDLGIIAAAHTASWAHALSLDVQRIIDSETYGWLFPETRLARRGRSGAATRQVGRWEVIGHRGVYRGCGIGGGITGMRADILIIDDPVKDDVHANSIVIRDRVWNWFTSTAYTRLSEGGGIIIMMTRWHQDDLVGRILAGQNRDHGDQWRVLSFPAIAEQDEPHRKRGQALSVERFSRSTLLAIRQEIGPYQFAALYQQRPAPAQGGIIKRGWINFYRAQPGAFGEIIASWDCSFTNSPGSDYVVGQVWGRKGGQFYLLDRVHDRMDFPTTIAAIRALSAKWPKATATLIENKANGPAVVSTLGEHIPGLIAINPEGSKPSRMSAASALFEAGNVFLPDPSLAPWIHDVIAEFVGFPNTPHDDDCDAMTQALLRLRNQRPRVLFRVGSGDNSWLTGELPRDADDEDTAEDLSGEPTGNTGEDATNDDAFKQFLTEMSTFQKAYEEKKNKKEG